MMRPLEMPHHGTSGVLITFCGLDGCGKTTMIRRLMAELEGEYSLFLTKQPTDAVRSSEIFRGFMDTPDHDAFDYRSLSLLAASDRLQHVKSVILPQLRQGRIVLSDRYFYSCLANLRARGFEGDEWIYEIARAVIRPDLAFFLDVPVELAVERVRKRPSERDRYIDLPLQHRLRAEYRDICLASGGKLIPTEEDEETCYQMIKEKVKEVLYRENI